MGLFKFIRSSIGKKVTMALSGLFLIGFLCFHLAVNSLLIFSPETYNAFANASHHSPLVKFLEWGLIALFSIHIIDGIILTSQNRRSRGKDKYEVSYRKHKKQASSYSMATTGLLILGFLIQHVWFYRITGWESYNDIHGHHDLYQRVVDSFTQSSIFYSLLYIFVMILLGFHLKHGFQSFMRTLGLFNQRYWSLIDAVSWVIAIFFAAGFSSLPIYFFVTSL